MKKRFRKYRGRRQEQEAGADGRRQGTWIRRDSKYIFPFVIGHFPFCHFFSNPEADETKGERKAPNEKYEMTNDKWKMLLS
jgi:hypothetical protein